MEIHPLAVANFLLYGVAFLLLIIATKKSRAQKSNPTKNEK